MRYYLIFPFPVYKLEIKPGRMFLDSQTGFVCLNNLLIFWSGRWDSNPRRPAWEADILPLNYARLSDAAAFLSSRKERLPHHNQ